MTVMCLRYITVLVEMTRFEGTRHGKKIAAQMLDVAIRVKDARPFAVRQMVGVVCMSHDTLWVWYLDHMIPSYFYQHFLYDFLYHLPVRSKQDTKYAHAFGFFKILMKQ